MTATVSKESPVTDLTGFFALEYKSSWNLYDIDCRHDTAKTFCYANDDIKRFLRKQPCFYHSLDKGEIVYEYTMDDQTPRRLVFITKSEDVLRYLYDLIVPYAEDVLTHKIEHLWDIGMYVYDVTLTHIDERTQHYFTEGMKAANTFAIVLN